MDEDVEELIEDVDVQSINEFAYFKSAKNRRSDIVAIDRYLKSKEHLISAKEKALLKSQETVVLGRKFVVNQTEKYVFIAPYFQAKNMSKKFKEKMRLLKIEPKLRGYLAADLEAVALLSGLLQ